MTTVLYPCACDERGELEACALLVDVRDHRCSPCHAGHHRETHERRTAALGSIATVACWCANQLLPHRPIAGVCPKPA